MNLLNSKKLWEILSYGHVPRYRSDYNGLPCNHAHFVANKTETIRNMPVVEEPELQCPICLSELGFTKLDDDKFEDFYIYKNMLFPCPQEIKRLFHFNCIYSCAKDHFLNDLKCPTCRKDLKEDVKTYLQGFFELFNNNPSEKLNRTLQVLMNKYNEEPVSIFKEIHFKKEVCEKILSLIKNLNLENSKKIRNAISHRLFKFEEEIISSEYFNDLCWNIENNKENTCRILAGNYNTVKKLNTPQFTQLIKKILSIKFTDASKELDALTILIYSIPETILNRFAQISSNECYIVSQKFLCSKSEKGLKFFIRLNKQYVEYDSYGISAMFDILYKCNNESYLGSHFYEAIKILIYEKTDDNSLRKRLIKRLNCKYFRNNSFNFLIKYFEKDDIFNILEETLINESKLFDFTIDFLFKNQLFSKYPNETNKIIRNFLFPSEHTHIFLTISKLEYLITHFKQTDSINNLEMFNVVLLINNCIEYKVSNVLLESFESFIERNLVKIVKICKTKMLLFSLTSLTILKIKVKKIVKDWIYF